MSRRIRRSGLLDRTLQRRDARLFVVATEDTYASPQYLKALQELGILDRSRIQIVVLESRDGNCSIVHLIDRLDEYRTNIDYKLQEDEYWIVFDVDHHRIAELSSNNTLARQKGYQLAGSNPCFELWLLLHETDEIADIVTHQQDSRAAALCESQLRRVLGQYNKKKIDITRYTKASIDTAIGRAERRDDASVWPASVGTHVHRLVKRLPCPI